jgi:alkaline phosphatase D
MGCNRVGNTPPPDPHKTIKRIAFGSCARQDLAQPIWNAISNAEPDIFVFLGDNIYADTEDMSVMAEKYRLLANRPEFARFRSRVPILATWDDHDFGINDGGTEYPRKEESKKLLLDFLGEPMDAERRQRPGIYTSYMFGPAGKRLQLILLDLRWFRTSLRWDQSIGVYLPDNGEHATILGVDQWSWLEAELQKHADLRIIASSIQFSSPSHPYEKWSNFPHEKRRILELLDRLSIKNALFISGDMHFGELSCEKTPQGFTVFDLTSSGLNLFEPGAHYPNRNRLAIYDQSANFGFIEIDFERSPVMVSLQVRDDQGRIVIRHDIAY